MGDTMKSLFDMNLDYSRPIRIAADIFWVGFYDQESGLHCNPYLIVDGDEAVVIDGGSRPDFPTVMTKILEAGIRASSIVAMICQHYDPDLCGGLPSFEDIIGRMDLRILSAQENSMFIRHYGVSSSTVSIESLQYRFHFRSGRTLEFIPTPFAHSAGSFITYDHQTGVLFTSDLFGSYGSGWELFLSFQPECHRCVETDHCPLEMSECPMEEILRFHRQIMTSNKALMYAVDKIQQIPARVIAPQHGSVIIHSQDIRLITEKLLALDGVGIDGILKTDGKVSCSS